METKEIAAADVDQSALSEATVADMLAYAAVLIELGWFHDAEAQLVRVLEEQPDNLRGLSLYAKAKHIRGELSQAIACWAQIYTQSAQSKRASTQLLALLHLADDPERSAAEFIALTAQPEVLQPSGTKALEKVFQLFAAHRHEQAKKRAGDVAIRFLNEDKSIYKLAILASAWINELTGDLDGACETLENLGTERGFETDEDRLLALARTYEGRSAEGDVERALKIYSHLDGAGSGDLSWCSSILWHLALLHERAGNNALSNAYSLRYVEAYGHRMHRPALEDTVRVAATRYVGLAHLGALRFWSTSISGPLSKRETMLVHALGGRRDQARKMLQGATEVLDKKYLADLARLDGDDELAIQFYLATLEEDPSDIQVLGCLLLLNAASPRDSITRYFLDPWTSTRVRRVLEQAVRTSPLRPSLWQQLSSLHAIIGDARESASCHRRAQELTVAADHRRRPVGRALAASVYRFIGQAHGLIHEVWVHREPMAVAMGGVLASDQILGNVTAEMRDGIRNTFFAVREYARTKFPRRAADLLNFNYAFKVPKEDQPSGGLSAGLPAALAFLSVFIQEPIPQTLASSGILVADAHDVLTIRRIGDAEHKVDAAYHRNLQSLILPRDNAAELHAKRRVPRTVGPELVHYVANFDEAVKLVFGENIFIQP